MIFKPIKVADFCTRLSFLILEKQEEAADEELDRVIHRLFRASLDDVRDKDWEAFLDENWKFEAAYSDALQAGYDLEAGSKLPVREWEYFWFMILAEQRGWVAQTQEEKAAVRLDNDAREFSMDRETIRIC